MPNDPDTGIPKHRGEIKCLALLIIIRRQYFGGY
jgi:hypothetical protein